MLSISQVLPGANGVNMAVMIGYRLAGFPRRRRLSLPASSRRPARSWSRSPSSIGISVPLPLVRDALSGMSIVAVGLIIAMAAKIAKVLQRRALPWAFALAAFIGVGVMRWPLLAVLGALAPFAIAAAWKGRM